MVDDEGEALGIISLEQALSIADERGMDLVEVSPNAAPPVWRASTPRMAPADF